jgi:hypothetical protein
MHNDRINSVQKLMSKVQNVNKFMNKPKQNPVQANKKEQPSRWKQKFIKIRDQKDMHVDGYEDEVGPNDFKVIAKLG